MPVVLHLILIVILIILGSVLLFFSIFGTELLKFKNEEKIAVLRSRFLTLWLTIGAIFLVSAFSLIVFSGDKNGNKWTSEQKEAMVKKIMESSIFIHGTGADTARLVSQCFIEKYTSIYTPNQMKEHDKLSNEELAKVTSVIMVDCLKKYGLPKIDSSSMEETHRASSRQMHL